jgi:hypothetical protein
MSPSDPRAGQLRRRALYYRQPFPVERSARRGGTLMSLRVIVFSDYV